jgi:hypothetical protein
VTIWMHSYGMAPQVNPGERNDGGETECDDEAVTAQRRLDAAVKRVGRA